MLIQRQAVTVDNAFNSYNTLLRGNYQDKTITTQIGRVSGGTIYSF